MYFHVFFIFIRYPLLYLLRYLYYECLLPKRSRARTMLRVECHLPAERRLINRARQRREKVSATINFIGAIKAEAALMSAWIIDRVVHSFVCRVVFDKCVSRERAYLHSNLANL